MDAHECWVCLEAVDPDGSATAPTGCACRGSAGHAHLNCLVASAQHTADRDAQHINWMSCPTCKQVYTGSVSLGLARARWGLHRSRREEDGERLDALNQLAVALNNTGKFTEAIPLYEEQLATKRRDFGDVNPSTLNCMVNLAGALYSTIL